MNAFALLLFVGTMGLSLWASFRVRSVFRRHSAYRAACGYTGAQTAAAILQREGIGDVEVVATEGRLVDHYDPIHKRLVLSAENFYGVSPAALGVAAHECGHAIQHRRAYAPLHWRMAAVGVTNVASQLVMWLPLLGMFTGLFQTGTGLLLMAVGWGVIMAFNLITLPVEFDASARAKSALRDLGLLSSDRDARAVNATLRAAAWTYVAAFITSLTYFLWHLLPLLTGSNRRD